jgi:hypothetical protein
MMTSRSAAVGAGCSAYNGNGASTSASGSGWPYELPSAQTHWWWMV